MKILMMGLVALILLGGGAGGAYFFLNKPAEASATEMSEVQKAEAAKLAAAREADAVPMTYVELDPLVLPIVDEYGVSQTVSLVIVLEVASEAEAETIERLQPRLKDAFIQDMYGVLSRKAVMSGGVLEVEKIKARLNKVSHKILGANVAHEVLLKVVSQRPV